MNITNNAMQPSFQARIKKNEFAEKFVNSLNDKDTAKMKTATSNLLNIAPNDVLEINHDFTDWTQNRHYSIKNETNGKEVKVVGLRNKLIDYLAKASQEGSKQYNSLFSTTEKGEKKEIIDMMV